MNEIVSSKEVCLLFGALVERQGGTMNSSEKTAVGAIVAFLIILVLIVVLSFLVKTQTPADKCKLDVRVIHERDDFLSKDEVKPVDL